MPKWRWKVQARDDEAEEWWFASIAIPLLAATIGPFANVLSIAALVSYWRENLAADGSQLYGITIKDPHWATALNVASLATGYVGNFFLFCNFTQRIRYMIALPATVVLWFISAFLLIGITIGMAVSIPPKSGQSYTQAYWYAVIAAVLYTLCSSMLLINLLGYFLGRYGQHFVLTYAQRTLILQTFLFFLWLAGGAAVFTKVEGWNFSNSLYFADVTILTIGFGDLVPVTAGGRALVIPYATGGIVFLGLMVTSISNFVTELGYTKVIRARFDRKRVRTLERSNTLEATLQNRDTKLPPGAFPMPESSSFSSSRHHVPHLSLKRGRSVKPERSRQRKRRLSLVLLREEKDRFTAMRRIQEGNAKFKKYTVLTSSIIIFFALWLVGAVVFWQVERHTTSNINSFYDGFYFCYISLITVGYGDYTPTSSAGRPFFVVWSLFAVPSVTILISSAANTVVEGFNRATNRVADFTLLPKQGIWRAFLNRHPWLLTWLQSAKEKRASRKRLEEGFQVEGEGEGDSGMHDSSFRAPSLEQIAAEEKETPSEHQLARRLAQAIRHTADDMKHDQDKRYSYEEWIEFTELIRFTSGLRDDEEGLINWDWIGEDSPMMAEQTEPEWLLDRLSESMVRYIKHQAPLTERPQSGDRGSSERNGSNARRHSFQRQVNFSDGTRLWSEKNEDMAGDKDLEANNDTFGGASPTADARDFALERAE